MRKLNYIHLLIIMSLTGCGLSVPISVNKTINSNYKYISDKDNYGKLDYFANYDEFISKGGGDCEDFAIAKYQEIIKKDPLSKDKMNFLLVKYNENKELIYHMVLIYDDGNEIKYLDLDNDTHFKEYWEIVGVYTIEYINRKMLKQRETQK